MTFQTPTFFQLGKPRQNRELRRLI